MGRKYLSKKEKQECKEANITFVDNFVILFFTIPILITFPVIINSGGHIGLIIYFSMWIVLAIVLTYLFSIKRLINNYKVHKYGEKVHAKVIGYYYDRYLINDNPGQIVELSIRELNKTIYYQLGKTTKEYEIDSEIEVLVYNDIYLINDEKTMLKERRMSIIIILLLAIVTFNNLSCIIVKYVFNTSYHGIRLSIFEKMNKEIKTSFNGLEYKIPDGYKLSGYEKNRKINFVSKNEKHYCSIDIYLENSSTNRKSINTCQYYDINNKYVNDEEIMINNSKWCHYMSKLDDSYDRYYFNNGKNYYNIYLYTYDDKDEKCVIDFSNFVKTLKVNDK